MHEAMLCGSSLLAVWLLLVVGTVTTWVMDGVSVMVLQGIWWEVTVTTAETRWDFHTFLFPATAFSCHPVYNPCLLKRQGKKLGKKKQENLDQNNSNKRTAYPRDGHFTAGVWRTTVLQSTREALVRQCRAEERRSHRSECPNLGSHPTRI